MSGTREVRTVKVIYADGEEEEFDPIIGFYRTSINYDKGAKSPDDGWRQHEIRWSDR
jgi:hypothetical protein